MRPLPNPSTSISDHQVFETPPKPFRLQITKVYLQPVGDVAVMILSCSGFHTSALALFLLQTTLLYLFASTRLVIRSCLHQKGGAWRTWSAGWKARRGIIQAPDLQWKANLAKCNHLVSLLLAKWLVLMLAGPVLLTMLAVQGILFYASSNL